MGKAKEMLLHNLEWRQNNKQLENVSNWIPPSEVAEDIVYRFTGFDYTGRPGELPSHNFQEKV